jgi:hypothetical protein
MTPRWWWIWFWLGACSQANERWFDAALQPCAVGASPQTIDAFIAHVNTLPEDASIACVVASLKRPLALVATRNDTSAQPAQGEKDPRVLIVDGDLVHAVVGVGRGSHLFELSERVGTRMSLKAELVFPLASPVTAAQVYGHLLYNEQLTTCGFCHSEEKLDAAEPGKAVSRALRPEASTLVPLQTLVDELKTCDRTTERCLLLAALVGMGPFVEGELPASWATFGEP